MLSIEDILLAYFQSCHKNCKAKTAREEKFILKSKCNKHCYGELSFTWTLYRYDDLNSAEPYNLSTLHEFTSTELKEMTSSPIDALEIAIKPKMFEQRRKYILAFRGFRPSGVFGELRYTFVTNDAPVDGMQLSIINISMVLAAKQSHIELFLLHLKSFTQTVQFVINLFVPVAL